MGRSQHGNNNPYCQDNEISWFDWDLTEGNAALLNFTRQLIQFRYQHLVFRKCDWIKPGSTQDSIRWFNPDGIELPREQWQNTISAMSLFLSGEGVSTSGGQEEDSFEDSFLLCFNARDEKVKFSFPTALEERAWRVMINTIEPRFAEDGRFYLGSETMMVRERSLKVLKSM